MFLNFKSYAVEPFEYKAPVWLHFLAPNLFVNWKSFLRLLYNISFISSKNVVGIEKQKKNCINIDEFRKNVICFFFLPKWNIIFFRIIYWCRCFKFEYSQFIFKFYGKSEIDSLGISWKCVLIEWIIKSYNSVRILFIKLNRQTQHCYRFNMMRSKV